MMKTKHERETKMNVTNVLLFLIFLGICYLAGREHGLFIGFVVGVVMIFFQVPRWRREYFAREDKRDCPHCLKLVPEKATVCRHCNSDIPV
jgi:hypothetical protein